MRALPLEILASSPWIHMKLKTLWHDKFTSSEYVQSLWDEFCLQIQYPGSTGHKSWQQQNRCLCVGLFKCKYRYVFLGVSASSTIVFAGISWITLGGCYNWSNSYVGHLIESFPPHKKCCRAPCKHCDVCGMIEDGFLYRYFLVPFICCCFALMG